jgi:hypothetical protein
MDAEPNNQWRFAQCFGDKGEVEDITEGMFSVRLFNQAEFTSHALCPSFSRSRSTLLPIL